MTTIEDWYQFRQAIVGSLETDLMGSGEEVLEEPPLDRYVVGILHPKSSQTMDEVDSELDDARASMDDDFFDPAIALSRIRYPSSVGLTFALKPAESPAFSLEVHAARYQRIVDAATPSAHSTARWQRIAPQIGLVEIASDAYGTHIRELDDGLQLYVLVRSAGNGTSAITAVLINTKTERQPGQRDELCWFEPRVVVEVLSGSFVPRMTTHRSTLEDEELKSYDLLFRDLEDLAVGHGCAVMWDEDLQCKRLSTTFFPWHDLRLSAPSANISMSDLDEGKLDPLNELIADYRNWIGDQQGRIPLLDPDLQAIADDHLQRAIQAANRMQRGLDLLTSNEVARKAFRLMNRAMALQRERVDRQQGRPHGPYCWRPFQIAYILMNLEGLSDPLSADREIADLLWFPTGGGKTEAYLGLIGFTILFRRFINPLNGGVSVMMRYTLRLLTIQQFERAARLVCALESVRREEMPNSVQISIGLWVGQSATPNSIKDAKQALRMISRGESPKKGNPVQLLRCPACGHELGYPDYQIQTGPDRMRILCPNSACDYYEGLPVYLIDEDVYRVRPSLVIGTVDKFAMMAWRAEVRGLFGRDGESSPPDLIVQDELHLISGPLGTMVGLYETAVDAAATGDARPKLVASTATIRRARQQVRMVFDREASQFPPPGLDAHDSYFAVEASPAQKGTRRYLGIMAPSVSHTTLMVRCYAALLQAAEDIPASDEVKDAYWSLIGYFNSLRVLGGAYMQVNDDVPARAKVIAGRLGRKVRRIERVGELTSRKRSDEIPGELSSLEVPYPNEEAMDVVLATNMISVGLDIDRLGLMVVMGQPQTTAEYIQATSRVGRQVPGLVVVLYNATRSRDLSHYENFVHYHRSIYRQVEATGATPFAARARDRGLHGVLVSMVRLLIKELSSDTSAVEMPRHLDTIQQIIEKIEDRVGRVAPEEQANVMIQLDSLLDAWQDACAQPQLRYPAWSRPTDGALIQDASLALEEDGPPFPVDDPAWPTMTSLRNVDPTTGLYLIPSNRRNRRG